MRPGFKCTAGQVPLPISFASAPDRQQGAAGFWAGTHCLFGGLILGVVGALLLSGQPQVLDAIGRWLPSSELGRLSFLILLLGLTPLAWFFLGYWTTLRRLKHGASRRSVIASAKTFWLPFAACGILLMVTGSSPLAQRFWAAVALTASAIVPISALLLACLLSGDRAGRDRVVG